MQNFGEMQCLWALAPIRVPPISPKKKHSLWAWKNGVSLTKFLLKGVFCPTISTKKIEQKHLKELENESDQRDYPHHDNG